MKMEEDMMLMQISWHPNGFQTQDDEMAPRWVPNRCFVHAYMSLSMLIKLYRTRMVWERWLLIFLPPIGFLFPEKEDIMAAGQVVYPFFGVVFERLKCLIHKDRIKELGPLAGIGKELKKLYRNFCKIKDVLDDAEEKQFKEEEEAVRFWMQELNDAAYEADDVFDEFEYESLQQLALEEASSGNIVAEQLCRKIQKLVEMFCELANECSGLDLQKGKEKSVVVTPDRKTISLLTEPQVYGRNEDRENLVKQLLGSAYSTLPQFRTRNNHPRASRRPVLNNQDNVAVYPILGIEGLGKTTLAQIVYNDERVAKHFDFRSWVCVSNDFDIKRIMKEIVAFLPRRTYASDELEELHKHFHEELCDKKYLLVLDDVWEERQHEWNKLKGLLRGGVEGSSIILTTRLQTVASIAGTLPPYCLTGLSKEDCWYLFKQYAFGLGNEEKPTLVKIGEKIVKKCRGLPLAAKALGGLLRYKNDENEWKAIEESEIWELPQSNDNNILPALRLSYYHLPQIFRQCFVYCAIFPKDYEIEKDELVQLWMANGLVQSQAKKELVVVGNDIFTALLWRSFFQDVEKDEDGNIKRCKMHDLVHDLACYMAGDEYFVEDVGTTRDISKRTRHASYNLVRSYFILDPIQRSSPCLRSLIRLNLPKMTLKSKFFFSDFIRLRALDLNSSDIRVVPDSIGEMKHLRYLNLSSNPGIISLPESICSVRSLQTLKLRFCWSLKSMPEDMRKLDNLRHLDIIRCDRLTSLPNKMRQLTHLQIVSNFNVASESGSRVEELQEWFKISSSMEFMGKDRI